MPRFPICVIRVIRGSYGLGDCPADEPGDVFDGIDVFPVAAGAIAAPAVETGAGEPTAAGEVPGAADGMPAFAGAGDI
jgi:hypothetical protein